MTMPDITRRFAALLTSAALFGCASSSIPLAPNDYYFDDGVITVKVETALRTEQSLPSSAVVVATAKRVVSLTGFVDSQAEIDAATVVAGNVGGVQSVKNGIRLKPR